MFQQLSNTGPRTILGPTTSQSLVQCLLRTTNDNKRQRTLDRPESDKDEKSRSYSQSRKDGDVPEQYTKSYEKYIFTQDLDMNYIKDRELVSSDSKVACQDLRKMECMAISPNVYSEDKIIQVIDLCQNANEAMISRDVTTLILPPIKALHLTDEEKRFKDLTDQVRAQWYEGWVLAGPRPEPDLAVGFLHSAHLLLRGIRYIRPYGRFPPYDHDYLGVLSPVLAAPTYHD